MFNYLSCSALHVFCVFFFACSIRPFLYLVASRNYFPVRFANQLLIVVTFGVLVLQGMSTSSYF